MMLSIFMFCLLFYIICKNIYLYKIYTLTIAVISCNRINYLNLSISSIYNHIKKYENDIYVTFINFDQGTPNREVMYKTYNIRNVFYMNPFGYTYSFTLLFSYLYSQYILLLEEDWIVINNIEEKIKYRNFLYISMYVLSKSKSIYGLYLRQHNYGNKTKRVDNRFSIIYYEIHQPWIYCYTNGASIYKSKYLKRMDYKSSESQTARRCMNLNYHIGYIYWEYIKSTSGLNYPFAHIGLKSTKTGICNISLY